MTDPPKHLRSSVRDGVWWAGLMVAVAAAAATAHGLYSVAVASDVPWPVAGLYPVMTDGLALVAYSATNRLTDGPRRYAWAVVIAAAGLSGGAQALYLAGGGVDDAPAAVRFGIGAAPALAAAGVAHLLHLIRTTVAGAERQQVERATPAVQPAAVQLNQASVVLAADQAVRPASRPGPAPRTAAVDARRPTAGRERPTEGSASASERSRRAAAAYRDRHGTLPTASELVRLTGVSRGTAGTVLKGLRTHDDDGRPRAGEREPDQSRATSEEHPTHHQIKIQNDHTPRHHDPEEDQQLDAATPPGGRR